MPQAERVMVSDFIGYSKLTGNKADAGINWDISPTGKQIQKGTVKIQESKNLNK